MKRTLYMYTLMVVAILAIPNMAMAQYDAKVTKLLDQASDLEDEAKYTEAAKIYQTLADEGNDFAQFIIAEYFLEGKGVEKNQQLGLKYATMAANQGHGHAIGLVLSCYAENPKAYFEYAKKIAENFPHKTVYGDNRKFPLIFDFDETIVEYAKCYLYGVGTKKDEDLTSSLIFC